METDGDGREPGDRPAKSGHDRLVGLLATLVGVGVGVYAGVIVIIPVLASLLTAFVARRLFGDDRQFIVPAVAVQAGHLIWFWAGVVLAGTVNNAILPDVLIMTAGLIWLIAAPGYVPIAALAAFQAFATWINADALLAAEWASIDHKALLVHLSLRFLSLTFLGHAALMLYGRCNDALDQ